LIQKFEKRSKEDSKYFDARLSGSSVALVIQMPKELIVGWVGDIRVCLKSLDSKIEDQLITPAHTPDIEEEK
jgi:serine/threonine protein phosphatase PrpC